MHNPLLIATRGLIGASLKTISIASLGLLISQDFSTGGGVGRTIYLDSNDTVIIEAVNDTLNALQLHDTILKIKTPGLIIDMKSGDRLLNLDFDRIISYSADEKTLYIQEAIRSLEFTATPKSITMESSDRVLIVGGKERIEEL